MSDETKQAEEQVQADVQANDELSERDMETVAGGWASNGVVAQCTCNAIDGGCTCSGGGCTTDW